MPGAQCYDGGVQHAHASSGLAIPAAGALYGRLGMPQMILVVSPLNICPKAISRCHFACA